MAHYEKGAYPPLIGGETQQIPQDRQPNQLSNMTNMIPDAVSGLRRRGGFEYLRDLEFEVQPYVHHVTVAEVEYLLMVEPGDVGRVRLYDIAQDTYAFDEVLEYMQGGTVQDVDYTVHSDNLYLLNRSKVVGTETVTSGLNPKLNGYVVVVAGAFGLTFDVGLNIDGTVTRVQYKTPDSGASNAQPEHIASQLESAAKGNAVIGTAAGFVWTRSGAYLHVQHPDKEFTVVTNQASAYLRVSNAGNVKDVVELAAKLPDTADGMVVRTGTKLASTYWKWRSNTQQWDETCAWGTDLRFQNLPVQLLQVDGVWESKEIEQAGRMSGDTENNPDPPFKDKPITGIGSFQGRLVFLTGSHISMSGTGEDGHWYRVSVVTLADTDVVSAEGTTTTGVSYRYCIPMDGDLILFSENQQSTITGRTVVTSKTISLTPSGSLPTLPHIKPVYSGRGILVAVPSTPGYCNIWELMGGEYRDARYSQVNTTLHLPRYIPDNLTTLTSGQTGTYAAAVLGDCSFKILYTVQKAGEVEQQSWGTWRYFRDGQPVQVIHAQFYNEVLYIVTLQSGAYQLLRWQDKRSSPVDLRDNPQLDNIMPCTVQDGVLTVPVHGRAAVRNGVVLYGYATPHGELVWDSIDNSELTWVSTPEGMQTEHPALTGALVVKFGWRFMSAIRLTPPAVYVSDRFSLTDNGQLHQMLLQVRGAGTVVMDVSDKGRSIQQPAIVPVLHGYTYGETAPRGRDGVMQFPVRLPMRELDLQFSTADIYDMCIESVEFGYRPHRRFARAPFGAGG